jgi:CHAT domain-containing protein
MRAGGTPPVRLFDLGPADVMDSAIRALRQKVEQAPRDLRTSDEKTVEEDFRSASNDLYKLLFSPLLPVIGSAKLVYIAADGEINRVPLQALVDQDDRYLVESYRFVYVLTGRDLVRRPVPKFLPQMVAVPGNKSKLLVPTVPRPQTRPGEIRPPINKPGLGTIIFAAPDYDSKLGQRVAQAPDGIPKNDTVSPEVGRGATSDETRGLRWRPLPGAAAEAEDLVKVLMEGSRFRPVKVYKGADAREEMFKAITAPQILHVATHGFYLPDEKQESSADDLGDSRGGASVASLRKARNPLLRSGIVLAGANAAGNTSRSSEHSGLVTAEEIALMNLRATELVVLSACESGLGNVRIGEGVYGLRHAFLYAGARTLVTSLFEVPDVETRELMRRFYQGLGAGRGKLEALNEAQLEMLRNRRKEKGAAHPFYWASFIVVGDPA